MNSDVAVDQPPTQLLQHIETLANTTSDPSSYLDELGSTTRSTSPPEPLLSTKNSISSGKTPTLPSSEKMGGSVEVDCISRSYISFSVDTSETRNQLPPFFYRVHHEKSATIVRNTHKECWAQPSEAKGIAKRLAEHDAFQSLGTLEDEFQINLPNIGRHLVWSRKHPPSICISAWDCLEKARGRAKYHYHSTLNISRRVWMAKIRASDLVQAYLVTDYRDSSTQLPIWVRSSVVPPDYSPIETQAMLDSGSEIWISIEEITSKLQAYTNAAYYTPEEWVALGHIRQSSVEGVFPFDGDRIHFDPSGIIRSQADEDWEWDCNNCMWYSRWEEERAVARRRDRKRKQMSDIDDIALGVAKYRKLDNTDKGE